MSMLLRHRVEVMTKNDVPDEGGGYDTEPSVVKTVRARIKPLSGKEQLEAMQLTHPVTHQVLVRRGHGIETSHWLRRGDVHYAIRSIAPHGEPPHRYDEILVESGVTV